MRRATGIGQHHACQNSHHRMKKLPFDYHHIVASSAKVRISANKTKLKATFFAILLQQCPKMLTFAFKFNKPERQ
ncbi:MAG: hypothetical protein K5896_03345 [Prevotella sp.]|nr:hypothetical protein [Prevotella sp.]